nr:uncharacterized protein LOC106629784 [Zonotrichia albicollis]XP_026653052.1 uncharacterized protein LOC106629784 [Zonotrichia albicollis]XP_026653053.1 uncharacterized protein LOC106629784 [Zonotrichia albicollis]XP_026653054.1 uncharacterized protein LOC106629784 [Zonotrichia albicollis]
MVSRGSGSTSWAPAKSTPGAVRGMDLALAQIKAFPLFISSGLVQVSSDNARQLHQSQPELWKGEKHQTEWKVVLIFQVTERSECQPSPELDQHRNVDLLWWVRTALPAVLCMDFTGAGHLVERCWGLFVLPTACSVVPVFHPGGMLPEMPTLSPLCQSMALSCSRVVPSGIKAFQPCLHWDLGLSPLWGACSLHHPQLGMFRAGSELHQPHFPIASHALLWLEGAHQLTQQFESPYVLFPFAFPPFPSPIQFNLKVLCSPFLGGQRVSSRQCRHSHALLFLSAPITEPSPSWQIPSSHLHSSASHPPSDLHPQPLQAIQQLGREGCLVMVGGLFPVRNLFFLPAARIS